ncbi:hypothetical protein HK097_005261 [Rhizophlyctis rosea]|uniref:NAD(P)-binding protein n=1 Tax=Rhizophlyctis rosea TaxID=64517 RepID=A0AAD5SGU7_9FUNG|nr:hypothetical protein HK097_005261 [Rhizophlyctis rosea]
MSSHLTIITGGNRGLGYSLAKTLLSQNHSLILTARSLEKAKQAAQSLQSSSASITPLELDVSCQTSVQSFITSHLPQIISQNSDKFITLVNNAGIMEKQWDITRSTNVIAPADLSRAFIKEFEKSGRKGGRIVTLSSGLGNKGCQSQETLKLLADKQGKVTVEELKAWKDTSDEQETAKYNLSKHLVNYLTGLLAEEGKPFQISVHAVDPGWCQTDMGGPNATDSAESGADSTAWLANLSVEEGLQHTGVVFKARKELPWRTMDHA